MSKQHNRQEGRPDLPIERGFPIERVNEIAEKEGLAKQWYRPVYTMHKWWARRPGCLFRAISLYSLLDGETDPEDIEVYDPGENQKLGQNGSTKEELVSALDDVDMENPEPLWDYYPKDVRIKGKKVLDPFMGGGTSLVEASRFGVNSVGIDLNPVAWFVTKKELEAGQTDVSELKAAFEQIRDSVADEILDFYKTPCPNDSHNADVMYNFWVKELDCVSCGNPVPLFNDYRVAAGRYENDGKYNVLCPDCGSVIAVDDWKEECVCDECHHEYVPQEGNTTGGNYTCPDCGQKYGITDAIQEQDGYNLRPYAIEYYCSTCDDQGYERSAVKGYKQIDERDKELFDTAKQEWEEASDLRHYIPSETVPEGATTMVSEEVKYDGHDLFDHGIEKWEDMFNERQLYVLSILLREIDKIEDKNIREYLLLAFSETLNYNTMMTSYNPGKNLIANIFNTNGFNPPKRPVENNVWGTDYGTGTFTAMWDMVVRGVEYSNAPTERYIEDGENQETDEFAYPIGQNTEISQGDMRLIEEEDEYDAVITDPPYYDNIIYSELSDFFYVWQKVLLEDEYDCFKGESTPRAESIVTNPYLNKTAEDFEHEMGEALSVINRSLKEDGVLAFTYHHSDSESWGELLESLCENGFEVTATYPINSDLNKFSRYEAVSFDIVIVARPTDERTPISWNSLRRRIVRTAAETQEILEENRELNSGDIGVIEMGKCFQEYSKHHGEVHRAGEIMTSKDVVNKIYGIIQEGERGEQDVYLDLLEEWKPNYSDLNKHLKRSDASEDTMKEMKLFRMEGGDFTLCSWQDEKRQAYVQSKVEEGNGDLTNLDKAHFLRYRYEHDRSRESYLASWDIDELQELCEDLAAVTEDETYLKMLGVDTTLAELTNK